MKRTISATKRNLDDLERFRRAMRKLDELDSHDPSAFPAEDAVTVIHRLREERSEHLWYVARGHPSAGSVVDETESGV